MPPTLHFKNLFMIGLAEFQISTLLSAVSSRSGYAEHSFSQTRIQRERSVCTRLSVGRLIDGLNSVRRKGAFEKEVTCLITDSRRVVPGALFFAIGGLRTDGNFYIEEAVDRGAVAIVTEQDLGSHFPIDYIQVEDVRVFLAQVAKLFYESPDEALTVTGITGTNGKTTVSMLLQYLMSAQDPVGLIGTIRYDIGKRTLPSFRTTPESVDVFALMSQMVASGCEHAVMEVSSHGISQNRVHGLAVDVAIFLNLTQDHLDYHESMEAYYQEKRKLFTGELGHCAQKSVVNVDCPYGRRLAGEIPEQVEVITFGLSADATVRAESVDLRADSTEFDLVWPEGRLHVVSPLLGRYNVSNLLAALAAAFTMGFSMEAFVQRVARFAGVPGRMERVDLEQPFNVLVDYAHTDDALVNATQMLREVTRGRLTVVFGCGGDRDRSKRAPMLRAALKHADRVIATSDNPRTEDLQQIFADMRDGVDLSNAEVEFVADRKHAISRAMDGAGMDDCILVAGKGHEAFQEFDGTVVPFDDRQVARELLRLKALNVEEA